MVDFYRTWIISTYKCSFLCQTTVAGCEWMFRPGRIPSWGFVLISHVNSYRLSHESWSIGQTSCRIRGSMLSVSDRLKILTWKIYNLTEASLVKSQTCGENFTYRATTPLGERRWSDSWTAGWNLRLTPERGYPQACLQRAQNHWLTFDHWCWMHTRKCVQNGNRICTYVSINLGAIPTPSKL